MGWCDICERRVKERTRRQGEVYICTRHISRDAKLSMFIGFGLLTLWTGIGYCVVVIVLGFLLAYNIWPKSRFSSALRSAYWDGILEKDLRHLARIILKA